MGAELGRGLRPESGSGRRILSLVIGPGVAGVLGAGEAVWDRTGLGRETIAEGAGEFLGAGELRTDEDFPRFGAGLGGERWIA